MIEAITKRLSYGNVMSTLALFVALGGVSYAATSLPVNSVGREQLKANAVVGSKVQDRSLRASDFAVGQLPSGPIGHTGQPGPPGPKGDPGTNGTNGKDGTNAATNVVVRSLYLATGAGQVNCNAGERAIGGGVTGDASGYYVNMSEPAPNSGTPTGWKGRILLTSTATPGSGTVYVVCASP